MGAKQRHRQTGAGKPEFMVVKGDRRGSNPGRRMPNASFGLHGANSVGASLIPLFILMDRDLLSLEKRTGQSRIAFGEAGRGTRGGAGISFFLRTVPSRDEVRASQAARRDKERKARRARRSCSTRASERDLDAFADGVGNHRIGAKNPGRIAPRP